MAVDVGALVVQSCLLWLWATHSMVSDALVCLVAWGFTFKTSGVWVKKTSKLAFAAAYILRGTSKPFYRHKGRPRTTKSRSCSRCRWIWNRTEPAAVQRDEELTGTTIR